MDGIFPAKIVFHESPVRFEGIFDFSIRFYTSSFNLSR